MFIKIFEILFLILSSVMALQLTLLMFNITKRLKPMRASDFVSSVAAMTIFYIINALVLALFMPQISSKFVMVFLAFAPFLIGRMAEYKTHKIFTIVQILIIICGIIYVVRF